MCSNSSTEARPFRPFSRAGVESLLDWFSKESRTLPWRSDPTPYHVWVSEIMLQQTRVEAVLRYYERFLNALPDVRSLAAAPEEQLMKLWEGLGYYSRARQMKKAAAAVAEKYGGEFPRDPAELRKLPGIGPYTAGAIASIAFGIPEPAVDGNVLRVLSRVCGCGEDIRTPVARTRAEEAVRAMIPEDRAGGFAQALMEVGALVCVPNGDPKCGLCPLSGECAAFREGLTDSLPVRSGGRPRRVENRTVLLLLDGPRAAIRKRPGTGLLAGLYEFPNALGTLSREEAVSFARKIGFQPLRTEPLPDSKHVFTHVEWHMSGWLMEGYAETGPAGEELTFAGSEELKDVYALPSAFSAYRRILSGLFREEKEPRRPSSNSNKNLR